MTMPTMCDQIRSTKESPGLLERLQRIGTRVREELIVYRLVLRHADTPLIAKIILGLAVGYLLLPFDLIPDFIPVLGHLDDAVLVPLLVMLALRLIPKSVIEECRTTSYRRERSLS